MLQYLLAQRGKNLPLMKYQNSIICDYYHSISSTMHFLKTFCCYSIITLTHSLTPSLTHCVSVLNLSVCNEDQKKTTLIPK